MIEISLVMIVLLVSALLVEGPAAAAANTGLEPWVVGLVGGVALVVLVLAGVLAYREWHHEPPK